MNLLLFVLYMFSVMCAHCADSARFGRLKWGSQIGSDLRILWFYSTVFREHRLDICVFKGCHFVLMLGSD